MLIRTLSAATILSLGLGALAAVPASAVVPSDPHVRESAYSYADVPASPKKAKKNTKTLVIMAYAKKKDSTTPALLKKVYFDQVDRWMRWQSAGRQGEKGTVTKWLKVSSSTRCTDQEQYMTRAIAAAKRAGYKPGKYQRIALYFPLCKQLFWAGLGTMGRAGDHDMRLWINGTPEPAVIAHESLHNYGLIHSAAIDCGKLSLPKKTSGCSVSEYGDLFDVMGFAGVEMSASAKLEVGWLSKKQSATIRKGSKTFTVVANDSSSTKLKVVRVDLGRGSYLDVEYRTGVGSKDPIDRDGVLVRVVRPHSDFDHYARTLVDVQPNNESTYSSLPAGQSWTSPGKARVSVISTDAGKAVVSVTMKAPAAGVPAIPAPPAVSAAPPENRNLPASGVAWLPSVSGNGMPVLEYDLQLVNAAGVVTTTTVDALGGALLSAGVGDLDYGSYQVRYRARNEIGTGAYSPLSVPLVVAEPLPVVAFVNIENQTVVAPFTWAQAVATVSPSAAGYEISRVYFTFIGPNGPIGTCEAINTSVSIYQFQCSSDYDASYLEPGNYLLKVDVLDSFSHAGTRTVAFTVAAP